VLTPRVLAWLSIAAIALAVAAMREAPRAPAGGNPAALALPAQPAAPPLHKVATLAAHGLPRTDAGGTSGLPPSQSRLVLVGIGGGMAILREAGGARTWAVRQGDRVEGMTVARIAGDRVRLEANGRAEELLFGAPDAETKAKPRAPDEVRVVAQAEGAADDESSEARQPSPVPPRPAWIVFGPALPPAAEPLVTPPSPPRGEGARDDEAAGT
jgi:hypothetical protein